MRKSSGSTTAGIPTGGALPPAPPTSPPSPGGGWPETISSLIALGCDADSAQALVRYLDDNQGHYTMQQQALHGWMHSCMTDDQITRWLWHHGYQPPAA